MMDDIWIWWIIGWHTGFFCVFWNMKNINQKLDIVQQNLGPSATIRSLINQERDKATSPVTQQT